MNFGGSYHNSGGHPFSSANPNTSGHISALFGTPSPSSSPSGGHPFSSGKPKISRHMSTLFSIPSPSVSPSGNVNCRTTDNVDVTNPSLSSVGGHPFSSGFEFDSPNSLGQASK